MSGAANLKTLDALRDAHVAVAGFADASRDALDSLAGEIRRATDWLAEQTQFWKGQLRPCQDEVVRAKSLLVQRQTVFGNNRVPDTTEQEEALAVAQRRLAHVEEKLDTCRRWVTVWDRACDEYAGPAQRLGDLVEAEMPKALAFLERLQASVAAYLETASPPRESAHGT